MRGADLLGQRLGHLVRPGRGPARSPRRAASSAPPGRRGRSSPAAGSCPSSGGRASGRRPAEHLGLRVDQLQLRGRCRPCPRTARCARGSAASPQSRMCCCLSKNVSVRSRRPRWRRPPRAGRPCRRGDGRRRVAARRRRPGAITATCSSGSSCAEVARASPCRPSAAGSAAAGRRPCGSRRPSRVFGACLPATTQLASQPIADAGGRPDRCTPRSSSIDHEQRVARLPRRRTRRRRTVG